MYMRQHAHSVAFDLHLLCVLAGSMYNPEKILTFLKILAPCNKDVCYAQNRYSIEPALTRTSLTPVARKGFANHTAAYIGVYF